MENAPDAVPVSSHWLAKKFFLYDISSERQTTNHAFKASFFLVVLIAIF